MRRTLTEMKELLPKYSKEMEIGFFFFFCKAALHLRKHYLVFVLIVVNLVILVLLSFIATPVTFILYCVLSLCLQHPLPSYAKP